MRISEALSPARDIEVRFEAAVLNVTYRPMSYTLEEIDRLEAEVTQKGGSAEQRKARLESLLDSIGRLVVSWDLTHDDESMIDPKDKDALRKVPSNVFTEIIKTVNADQRVGEAERPSDDS